MKKKGDHNACRGFRDLCSSEYHYAEKDLGKALCYMYFEVRLTCIKCFQVKVL